MIDAALVSRQFVEMTRVRVEGLLAAFPKLVGTGKQHTYVETENIRYVFQTIEVWLSSIPWLLNCLFIAENVLLHITIVKSQVCRSNWIL